MNYFYDLHCHTSSGSADAPGDLRSVVRMAKKRGLDGIAVTDHNHHYEGPLEIEGIEVVPGVEVTVEDGQHLLAYFVSEPIESWRSFEETIKEIHEKGGFAVWAHPLRKGDTFQRRKSEVLPLLDGLESGNAKDGIREMEESSRFAKEFRLLETAGSDVHVEGEVGMGVVRVKERITRDNFREVMKEGEIVIRKEIEGYKKRRKKWDVVLGKIRKVFFTHKSSALKVLFHRAIVRNYLRLCNIKLRRIQFNYKEEYYEE